MIIWIDNHAFPPTDTVKALAAAAGAALIVSEPLPRDYVNMSAGAQVIPDPPPYDPGIEGDA